MSEYLEFGPAPGNCSGLTFEIEGDNTSAPKITFKWTDSVEGIWGGTILTIKDGSMPYDENDGTIIINSTTKDKYKTTGVEFIVPAGTHEYYAALFPYSSLRSTNRIKADDATIKEIVVVNTTVDKTELQDLYDTYVAVAADPNVNYNSKYDLQTFGLDKANTVLTQQSVTKEQVDTAIADIKKYADKLIYTKPFEECTWQEVKDYIDEWFIKVNKIGPRGTSTKYRSIIQDLGWSCGQSKSVLIDGEEVEFIIADRSNNNNGWLSMPIIEPKDISKEYIYPDLIQDTNGNISTTNLNAKYGIIFLTKYASDEAVPFLKSEYVNTNNTAVAVYDGSNLQEYINDKYEKMDESVKSIITSINPIIPTYIAPKSADYQTRTFKSCSMKLFPPLDPSSIYYSYSSSQSYTFPSYNTSDSFNNFKECKVPKKNGELVNHFRLNQFGFGQYNSFSLAEDGSPRLVDGINTSGTVYSSHASKEPTDIHVTYGFMIGNTVNSFK